MEGQVGVGDGNIEHSIGIKAGKVTNYFALLVTNKFLCYYTYSQKRGLTFYLSKINWFEPVWLEINFKKLIYNLRQVFLLQWY